MENCIFVFIDVWQQCFLGVNAGWGIAASGACHRWSPQMLYMTLQLSQVAPDIIYLHHNKMPVLKTPVQQLADESREMWVSHFPKLLRGLVGMV